jgi:hypothetical protein
MRDFEVLAHSLVLDPPLSEGEIAQARLSSDPWSALAYMVHQASIGDFAGIGRVEALMRSYDSALFWSAATTFAGIAGPWATVDRIAESFQAERHRYGVQYYISNMLMYACNPAHAEFLIELYEAGEDDDIRDHIARNLSLLLEPDYGVVSLGAAEYDKYPIDNDEDDEDGPDYASLSFDELFAKVRDLGGYRRIVFETRAAMYSSGVPEGSAVFEGALLDARRLAQTLVDRTAALSGVMSRVFEGTHLLSAMTGTNCHGILNDSGNLNPLRTCALLEEVLENPALDLMVPGRRYFFGHPVPD